jgi:hypothetical protein
VRRTEQAVELIRAIIAHVNKRIAGLPLLLMVANKLGARLVDAVTLSQLAAPEFRSCLVSAKPAPNLRHAATAQALSSSFWTPTHAAVQAADLIAAFLARPHPRRGMRRHRTKRALGFSFLFIVLCACSQALPCCTMSASSQAPRKIFLVGNSPTPTRCMRILNP